MKCGDKVKTMEVEKNQKYTYLSISFMRKQRSKKISCKTETLSIYDEY